MKLICEREKLLDALKAIVQHAKAKNTIPILRFARLRAAQGLLSIGTTDLTMWGEATLAAEVSVDGDCAASADHMMRLAAGFPVGAQVKIECDGKIVTLTCGRSTYRLETLPASDWPECPDIEDAREFSLPAETAKRLFDPPGEAIENMRGARPYLEGGFLHQDRPGEIAVVGTNAYRLIRVTARCDFELGEGRIVPMDTMNEISKLAKETLLFTLGSNLIRVHTETVSLTSKLLDYSYPDFRKIIPAASGPSFTVDRAELVGALQRLAVLASEKPSYRIAWKAAGDEIVISLRGNGTGNERIAATISHPSDGEMGFSTSNLNPALRVFAGETLEFFGLPGDHCRIVDPSAKDLTVAASPWQLGVA